MKHMLHNIVFLLIIYSTHTQCTNNDIKKQADTYAQEEHFTKAIELYTACYRQNPYDQQSLFNVALCLLKIGRIAEAIQTFESIIPLIADPKVVQYNIGYAYKVTGDLATAIRIYTDIIDKDPTYDPAHLALGFAYLQQGDFTRGWEQHSRYLKQAKKNGEQLRALLRENNIAGKKILLTYEGGLGDTVMFIRYAQRLKNMGAFVICMVQKPLVPLLSLCPYIDTVIAHSNTMPEHDARASLMSLPAICNDTEETFPVEIPYVYPNKKLAHDWKATLVNPHTLTVGICWQSDVFNDSSRLPIARRGMPLALFEPLINDSRFTVISLQKKDGAEQTATLSAPCRLISYENFDTDHGSFMDTAAVIQNLDVVVAIDSAVAHLAGALGTPTFLLLPYSTDWRWISGRTDSPWYPHHRIFKQPAPFDWDSVMQMVYQYLESLYLLKKDRYEKSTVKHNVLNE